jgi:hypothetical protein
MHRISLPWIFDVVKAIDALSAVNVGSQRSLHVWTLLNAKKQLEALFSESIYSQYLRISRQKAGELHTCIEQMSAPNDDPNATVDEVNAWWLQHNKDHFQSVFISEISTLPSYLVGGKEGYDTDTLLNEGTKLFPKSLAIKAPEAVQDAMLTGRALAFELATACGFHVLG